MARNFAIAIGINKYEYLTEPLKYAKRDAELMRNFFLDEMKFEQVFYYADDSPPDENGASTRPTRANLRRLLAVTFKKPILSPGDNFWFFFSGHGEIYNGQDYLMPCDAFPEDIQNSAISVNDVIQYLRGCGADNIILMLDACRNRSDRKSFSGGMGAETERIARQTGIISLFSCSRYEYSYEIDQIQQGSFTYALIESLQIQGAGNCATVERLNNRLSYRVREINQSYGKPRQTPYTIVEPAPKYHLILLEKQATDIDILILISDAQEAENEGKLELSVQFWTRVLAVSPANEKAVAALMRIGQKLQSRPNSSGQNSTRRLDNSGSKSPTEGILPKLGRFWEQFMQSPEYEIKPPSNDSISKFPKPELLQLKTFEFDVVTLGRTVKEKQRQRNSAEYFMEDLGNGVTLDMVKIPAGEFLMGSPESEERSYKDERPQHQVKLDSFFMGKDPITQAQWKAVASLPKLHLDLNPDPARFKGENRPVERVSWYDAVEFCARLSKHTGKFYCLPSEAQWEYACRAGTTTPFHFGETISTDVANYNGNYTYGSGSEGVFRKETTPVGSLPVANNFGLFDMHGNVWEWCADPWHKNYEGAPTDGSVWDENINDNRYKNYVDNLVRLANIDTSLVTLRGSSWCLDPSTCHSAYRSNAFWRNSISSRVGFRVVCVAGRTERWVLSLL